MAPSRPCAGGTLCDGLRGRPRPQRRLRQPWRLRFGWHLPAGPRTPLARPSSHALASWAHTRTPPPKHVLAPSTTPPSSPPFPPASRSQGNSSLGASSLACELGWVSCGTNTTTSGLGKLRSVALYPDTALSQSEVAALHGLGSDAAYPCLDEGKPPSPSPPHPANTAPAPLHSATSACTC